MNTPRHLVLGGAGLNPRAFQMPGKCSTNRAVCSVYTWCLEVYAKSGGTESLKKDPCEKEQLHHRVYPSKGCFLSFYPSEGCFLSFLFFLASDSALIH